MPRNKDQNDGVLLMHAFVGYYVLSHLNKNLSLLGMSERNLIAVKKVLTLIDQILFYDDHQKMHLPWFKSAILQSSLWRASGNMSACTQWYRHITPNICALIEMYSIWLIEILDSHFFHLDTLWGRGFLTLQNFSTLYLKVMLKKILCLN